MHQCPDTRKNHMMLGGSKVGEIQKNKLVEAEQSEDQQRRSAWISILMVKQMMIVVNNFRHPVHNQEQVAEAYLRILELLF